MPRVLRRCRSGVVGNGVALDAAGAAPLLLPRPCMYGAQSRRSSATHGRPTVQAYFDAPTPRYVPDAQQRRCHSGIATRGPVPVRCLVWPHPLPAHREVSTRHAVALQTHLAADALGALSSAFRAANLCTSGDAIVSPLRPGSVDSRRANTAPSKDSLTKEWGAGFHAARQCEDCQWGADAQTQVAVEGVVHLGENTKRTIGWLDDWLVERYAVD